MHWSELFSVSEDFRYPLNLRTGDAAAFFSATSDGAAILSERSHWIETAPSHHLGFVPGATDCLVEVAGVLGLPPRDGIGGVDLAAALGRTIEPDFLILVGPRLHVVAGCVCFPSMWAPEEKFGQPLEFVHAPVPGLNEQLGAQLERFFSRLRPGASWNRTNWGLSRSAELNQHPVRGLPRLTEDVSPDNVWLRVEHQSLYRLPLSGAVLFGIRIENVPLTTVLAHREARPGLAHQLATMPAATVAYKGLTAALPRLVEILGG